MAINSRLKKLENIARLHKATGELLATFFMKDGTLYQMRENGANLPLYELVDGAKGCKLTRTGKKNKLCDILEQLIN